MTLRFRFKIFLCSLLAAWLCGCSTVPANRLLVSRGETSTLTEVMARKDKIVLVSSLTMDPHKPVLLLLHGATDDPTEMMNIVEEASGNYNVLLYCYNFHLPLEKLAADLAGGLKPLIATNRELHVSPGPLQNLTILTYSYSSAIFREAVLFVDDPALFSHASLIQLVPTPGGSYLARKMGNHGIAWLISQLSQPSATENPNGQIAKNLWGDEGSRKFDRSISPARVHSIVIEGDQHSVNHRMDADIQKRYQNGIGSNVIVIPKLAGITHEDVPNQPLTLSYLRVLLGLNPTAPTLARAPKSLDAPSVSAIP